jgi:ABC-type uncharacterized transport system substrate-binding protein
MWTWIFARIRFDALVMVVAVISNFLAAADNAPPTVPTLTAVQWLPKHAESRVLDAMEKSCIERMAAPAFSIERVKVTGDREELRAQLATFAGKRPSILIAFGDVVAGEISEQYPGVPLLALLVKWPEKIGSVHRTSPLIVVDAQPCAGMVWDVARQLVQGVRVLGIMYTRNVAANEALVAALAVDKQEGQVVPVTVPEGMCRVDADFSQAIEKAVKTGGVQVLYVPDDPNASRFAGTIYRSARALHVAAIGSDATSGKGCDAAILTDYEATGVLAAECAVALCSGAATGAVTKKAPMKIEIVKEEQQTKQGK